MSTSDMSRRDDANVVLTGFMGTGKTTTGRLLAVRLGFEFVDTDAVIVDRHGPIPDIFRDAGEARFRTIERELAVELASGRRQVISTGGGMLLDRSTADVLATEGRIFCLTAEVDAILERVGDSVRGVRPLLDGPDPRARIDALLSERADRYAAFDQVATDGRSPDEVAAELERRLGLGT